MPDPRQRQKNLALLGVLLGLAVILFVVTIIKVGHLGAPAP